MAQSLHRNDGNKTDFVVVVKGRDGVVARHYASSWKQAKLMADIASTSRLVLEAFARNEETGEEYRP